jgi:hypothetical protein
MIRAAVVQHPSVDRPDRVPAGRIVKNTGSTVACLGLFIPFFLSYERKKVRNFFILLKV